MRRSRQLAGPGRGSSQMDGHDRGSVTLWIVIFAVAVIALAMLLADGGSLISAKERAADIAEQGARAAADDISVTSLRNNIVQINPDACQQAGDLVAQYRLSPRMSAAMASCNIQPQQATVTISVAIDPLIPGFTGKLTKTVTATAKPECGITQGGACP
jgi:Flp pilus assembly protein TadG